MHFSTIITGLVLMSTTGWAQYVLEDDYMGNGDFFSKFSFWTDPDPTHGFVKYLGSSDAHDSNLTQITNGQAHMGVDSTKYASSAGRRSVRITSDKSYNSGLVIVDLEHMPSSACGSWPAFWMVGPDWPVDGEIDILEGVNDQKTNDFTLHTGPGCSISDTASMSGSVSTKNCDVNAQGQNANAGCQVQTDDTRTYGDGFNANKGGVYVTELTASAIKIYFFPRGSIPADITSDSPSPSSWGAPMANFQGDCDIPNTFRNLQIVFDTTFCGAWAGNTWASSSCAATYGSSCNDFVQNNGEAFEESYWTVNSLKVYQSGYGGSSPPVASSSKHTSALSTAGSTYVAKSSTIAELPSISAVLPTISVPGKSTHLPPPAIQHGSDVSSNIIASSSTDVAPFPAAPSTANANAKYAVVTSYIIVYATETSVAAPPSNDRPSPVVKQVAVNTAAENKSIETASSWDLVIEDGNLVERPHGRSRHARHLRHHKRHAGRHL